MNLYKRVDPSELGVGDVVIMRYKHSSKDITGTVSTILDSMFALELDGGCIGYHHNSNVSVILCFEKTDNHLNDAICI